MTYSSSSKTIAIDFDGVLHRYSKGWHDGTIYDDAVDDAKECTEKILKEGYTIVIFSTRHAEQISMWLGQYLPHLRECEIFSKPRAQMYIDDRAFRFTNWNDTRKYIT